ncbi:hypothetical protein [Hymenobacter sp. B81]|uniref:hypothetical protein n=1 Tax=Hymenobacter sp. B81 TaxID=3344878 RepID=UPI0037DC949D
MSLKRFWLPFISQLAPNISIVLTRLAAGTVSGQLQSVNPVVLAFSPSGQQVTTTAMAFAVNLAAGTHTMRAYSSNSDSITYINLMDVGVRGTEGDPDGTFDASRFVNLNYVNVSGGYVKKGIGTFGDAFYVRSGLLTNQPLDLSQVSAVRIFGDAGRWSSIVLPTDRSRLTYLNLGGNRMSGTFTAGSMPVLRELYLSSDQNLSRLTTISVVDCPVLEVIDFGSNRTTSFLYTTAYLNKLRIFKARFAPFTGSAFANLTTLIDASRAATEYDLRECSLTADEFTAVLDLLLTTPTGRPAATGKMLRFEGVTVGQANEASVRQLERDKINTLSASNSWVVSFNRPTMNMQRISGTTVRLTYTGTKDITIWAVGDTIRLSGRNGTTLALGDYQITAGSGKVWDIAANMTESAATGVFDKI